MTEDAVKENQVIVVSYLWVGVLSVGKTLD